MTNIKSIQTNQVPVDRSIFATLWIAIALGLLPLALTFFGLWPAQHSSMTNFQLLYSWLTGPTMILAFLAAVTATRGHRGRGETATGLQVAAVLLLLVQFICLVFSFLA